MRSASRSIAVNLLVLALGACATLQQVASNLPPAETPRLYSAADAPPALPSIQSASSVTSRGGPLVIAGLTNTAPCEGASTGSSVPPGRVIVLNIMKRSLTTIEVRVNGTVMREPESDDQERWWTEDGTGYYYLDKESFGTRDEVNHPWDDERIAIRLPDAFVNLRPLTIEVRGVSNNANYTGLQKVSAPLVVNIPQCPNYSLSVSQIRDVARGGSGTATVNVSRNSAMTSDVQLSATTAQAGVTVSLAPTTVPASQSTSVVTLTAAANAPTGAFAVSITGLGANLQRSTSFTARVVAPDFTFFGPSQAITVRQGGTATFQLSVNRNSAMQAAVSLATSGLPANVTVSYQPQPLPVAQTTVTGTATAGVNAAIGTSPLTFTATGGGITKTATGTLNVTALDAHADFPALDCNCGRTGDYVLAEPPVQADVAPGGAFRLTQSPTATGVNLLLTSTSNNACTIGVGSASAQAKYAFSPHGKYFLVADKQGQTQLSIRFYPLQCNATAAFFSQTLYVPPTGALEIASWGFGPDAEDRTFAIGASISQQTVRYSLVNLKALTSNQANWLHLVAEIPASETAYGSFSPCGDVYQVTRTVNNNLQFNFTRTRDFTFFGSSGVTLTGSTTNLGGTPFVDPDYHKIRVTRSNGAPYSQDVLPNRTSSNNTCP